MDDENYFNYYRRFGVEIELNSLDKRDFKLYPLKPGEMPAGIYEIGLMVSELFPNNKINFKTWHPVHNNDAWVLKPDSSCGIELCTPVLRFNQDLNIVHKAITEIKNKYYDLVDDRCSFHVHVDVSDLSEMEITAVLAYWIKCEAVFMDSVPLHRKKNRYCMMIGSLDIFQHDTMVSFDLLVKKLGLQKYFTLNTFHYNRNNRKSIEFRIAEAEFCRSPVDAVNWIKLIIHFVECASRRTIPNPYQKGDIWSSYLWLNPKEVFHLLKFDELISPDLQEVRNWFLNRIKSNISAKEEKGIYSQTARKVSQGEIEELL